MLVRYSYHYEGCVVTGSHSFCMNCLTTKHLCSIKLCIPFAEPPSAPGSLTLTSQQSSITVVWSLPASTGGRSDFYYQVEHSDPDNLGTYTGTDYVSGGSTSHSFNGLRPDTQYCVRVIAHNGVSDQDSDGTHLRIVEECTRTAEGRESLDCV